MDFFMSEEDERQVVEMVAEVLERLVDTSGCASMAALWLNDTASVRSEHLRKGGWITGTTSALAGYSKGSVSKYQALAAWRFALLLEKSVLDDQRRRHREAVCDIYFTPYVEDRPPFAWTKKSSRCPNIDNWSSPTALDVAAKHGCRATVSRLCLVVEEHPVHTVALEFRKAVLKRGARRTLADVLRYASLEREEQT